MVLKRKISGMVPFYISERKEKDSPSRWSHTCQTHHSHTVTRETDENDPVYGDWSFSRITTVDSWVDANFLSDV